MTREEIAIEIQIVARKISRERGIPLRVARGLAVRAAARAGRLPTSHGLGADVIPTRPVAIAETPPGAPAILANISAAGDDPSVVAARNAVSKWSWLIPVGGLVMSAKNKISAWRSPLSAAVVGSGRRR